MVYTITTPLYYVNDKPHLGSTYTTIACDALARFSKLQGEQIEFITGVDEHGQKIERTAHSLGIEPKAHCDNITNKYKTLWSDWGIVNNKFVRTSEKKHRIRPRWVHLII